jgi:hypothetical protein
LGPTSAKHRRSRFWRGEEKVARLIEGLQLRTILINDWQGRLRPTDPLYAGSHSSRLITDDRFWRQTGRSLRLSPAVGYAPLRPLPVLALERLGVERNRHTRRVGNAGADVKELPRDNRNNLARAIGLVQELARQFAAAAQNQVDAAPRSGRRNVSVSSRCPDCSSKCGRDAVTGHRDVHGWRPFTNPGAQRFAAPPTMLWLPPGSRPLPPIPE